MAEKAQLDQQSPTRDALAFNRIYLLMNAELQSAVSSYVVSPADVQTYYDANKTHFAQVKVKAHLHRLCQFLRARRRRTEAPHRSRGAG